MADTIAKTMGSWTFIIVQTALVVAWITLNTIAFFAHWDPWPFVVLNLLFSTQAAYAAPIIMMSQNRQAERDRHHAEADYETNRRSEEEIKQLQAQLAKIELEKLNKIITLLEERR